MIRQLFGFFLLVFLGWGQQLVAQDPSDSFIKLSHNSGHYSKPFYLKASYSQEATVRYSKGKGTLGGTKYRMPDSLLVSSTMPMRLFYSDEDTSFTVELFYAINMKTKLPIVSVAIDTVDMWDPVQGIYVPGPNIYYDSTTGFWLGNNFEKGWEKPVSIVIIDTTNEVWINQAGGLKIFGGMSKFYKEKSLRLISRREYGKSRFKYKFFKDRERKSYKSVILRMSGQDYKSTRFRDALATQISKDFNIDIQEYQPVLLFLNGENWGVYNLREKINARFVSESLDGGDESKIDLIQGHKTAESGTSKPYLDFWENLKQLTPNTWTFRTMVDTSIDIQNFLNFHIAQIYMMNLDYRGNIRFWREAPHGKLRWIMYDTDYSFGRNLSASKNFLAMRLSPVATAYHNPPWSTYPLRRLMEDSMYRHEFILQSCYAMSDIFSQERVTSYIEMFERDYAFDIENNHPKIKMSRWQDDIEKMRRFAEVRPSYFLDHLATSLRCDKRVHIVFENSNPEIVEFQINNNRWLNYSILEGTYFKELTIPWKARVKDHRYYLEVTHDTIRAQDLSDSLRIIIKPQERGESIYHGQILINEVRPHKDSTAQWIELLIKSDTKLDFKGWSIISKHGQSFLKETLVEDNQVVLLGASHFLKGFKNLSKEKDMVFLIDDQGDIVDAVNYANGANHPFVFRRVIEEDYISTDLMYTQGEGSPGAEDGECSLLWLDPQETEEATDEKKNSLFWLWLAAGVLVLIVGTYFSVYQYRRVHSSTE